MNSCGAYFDIILPITVLILHNNYKILMLNKNVHKFKCYKSSIASQKLCLKNIVLPNIIILVGNISCYKCHKIW